jgi:preprotein translocase subunit Sec61beta
MNGALQEHARAAPPKETPAPIERGFLAWDLILSGAPSDAIAQAIQLDPDAALQLCATVKRVTDVAGFWAAAGANQAQTARGATTPASAPFRGLLSYWDRELICRYANAGHESWFKKPMEAILGHEMAELLGPVWFALCEPRIRLGVLTGKTQDFALITATEDGGMAHYLNYYVPSRSATGRIIGFFCYVVELADAKR